MADEFVDYYELLGISPEATAKEIKQGYRAKALIYHPDKHSNKEWAEKKFHDIKKAADILSTESTRILYDKKYQAHKSNIIQKQKLSSTRIKLQSDLEKREELARTESRKRKNDDYFSTLSDKQKAQEMNEELRREMEKSERERWDAVGVDKKAKRDYEDVDEVLKSVKVKWKKGDLESDLKEYLELIGTVSYGPVFGKSKKSALVVFESILDAESAVKSNLECSGVKLDIKWVDESASISYLEKLKSSASLEKEEKNELPDEVYKEKYEEDTLKKMMEIFS